jgi:hypothetical protein
MASLQRRTPLLVLVGTVMLAVGLGALWQVRALSADGPDASATEAAGAPVPVDPMGVLRAWDDERARAYAEGDVDALRRLYAPGATAGRRDVRLLRRYLSRGLTVTGMQTQRLSLRVRDADPGDHELVLVVTDRVIGAVAVGVAHQVPLPQGAARTRVMRLADRSGRWLVSEVHAVGRG